MAEAEEEGGPPAGDAGIPPEADDGGEGSGSAGSEDGSGVEKRDPTAQQPEEPDEEDPNAPPFKHPEHVGQYMLEEDHEALHKAWADAEEKALLWAQQSAEEEEARMMQYELSSSSSMSPSRRPRVKRRKKPGWNNDFHLLGNDARAPPGLRRYFDELPAEHSEPKPKPWRGAPLAQDSSFMATAPASMMSSGSSPKRSQLGPESPKSPKARAPWNDMASSLASRDNVQLHKHLRHYFDRRGFEGSFRTRPHTDCEWLQKQRPRTPTVTAEDLAMRWTRSEPSLGPGSPGSPARGGGQRGKDEMDPLDVALRHEGSVSWSSRCLWHGPDQDAKPKKKQEKIPWVDDHHLLEAQDNLILNPRLRHYFDEDGLEASFRNRGRHWGRPLKGWPGGLGTGTGASLSKAASMPSLPAAGGSTASSPDRRRSSGGTRASGLPATSASPPLAGKVPQLERQRSTGSSIVSDRVGSRTPSSWSETGKFFGAQTAQVREASKISTSISPSLVI